MPLTPEEVKKIATLSRVGLTGEEVQQATENLSGILDHFSTIQTIDTRDVPVADAVSGLTNVTREDVPAPEALSSTQELLDRAPALQGRHIKVRAVF